MRSTDQPSIRRATANDSDSLAPLLAQLGYPTSTNEVRRRLKRLLETPEAGVLVAEARGEVVGVATFQILELIYRPRPQCRITALVRSHRPPPRGHRHRAGGGN